ncbi:MAG: hypothetical protein V3S64_03395 [bacterium]
MFEGTIKKMDLANRSAIVTGEDGKEISIQFTERVNVEIGEEETAGWMGGELEDVEEGFIVELDLSSQKEDGSFMCDSVVCIS